MDPLTIIGFTFLLLMELTTIYAITLLREEAERTRELLTATCEELATHIRSASTGTRL